MRLLRVAASAIASALLVAGVPWLLATTIGNPADHLPDLLAGDVNDQVILAAIAAVLWLAWAQFTVAFLVELVSAIRRTPMPARIPGVFTAQQGLARALVSGALLLLPLSISTVAPAAQAIAMTPAAAPPAPSPAAAAATGAADDLGDRGRGPPADPHAGGDGHRRRRPHVVGPRAGAPGRRLPLAATVEPQPGPHPGRRHRPGQ